MKRTINEFLSASWLEIEEHLRLLCGRPSPAKRLVVVLVAVVIFAAVNIYFVVSSLSDIDRNVKSELIELQHIEMLELQKIDSIHTLKK